MQGLRVDGATVCQLRCPSCPTAKGKMREFVGDGYLRFVDFKHLIDRNPWVRSVELSNWGELFLNPDLLHILRYAYEKDVALTAFNGVNLNTVRESVLEGLARYRFREMTCSIDGASEETYAVYRRRGRFGKVIENIKRINHYKQKHGSEYPHLTWQFVIFGHNEHEIPAAKRMADELRMDIYFKLSWDEKFSPPKDTEFIKREAGLEVATRSEFEEKYGRKYLQKEMCAQLWTNPQINFDGKILGCCVNRWGDFGQTADWRLSDAVNNERIRYARQMLTGRREPRADIPCTTCTYYHAIRASGNWVKREDVEGVR
ncbi:MAG: radical SAM protein [Gammaproteobacteria bacterium]|nr:radical SAM protein [Gammaproteobacteria bacterium]NIR85667.1 radical SAM protein [Gammaproteobacteria bacterium]NIR90155.1 radical SAM protein [Gammaproteobacteria bacterium]NIU06801.1 radical SAM protein [Gammaproteobacteria bacterium]NIV53734.1 radical SAM protein [Gammaproteobacteria bacterium]